MTILSKRLTARVKSIPRKAIYTLRTLNRKRQGNPYGILFYPNVPHSYGYVVSQICYLLGYRIVNDPQEKFSLVVNWQDDTFRTVDNRLADLARKFEVCNIRCNDISKTHVDSIFNEVFGYRTQVDPLTYQGRYVEKSNLNGLHDGKILERPITRLRQGYIYQKLIDSACDGNFVKDIRIPVFKENIPFVYLKYKPIHDRFGLSVTGTVAETDTILSQEECANIMVFCKKMGLDYGELDVLRDNTDGKLYIVDVNNTPTVRFVGFTDKERRTALKRLAQAFERTFINAGALYVT